MTFLFELKLRSYRFVIGSPGSTVLLDDNMMRALS